MSAFLQRLPVLKCALHGGNQVLAFEWLQKVVVGAAAHRVDGHADVVDCRDHDDGQIRILRVNALQQGQSVALLHHDVRQNQFEGVLVNCLQGFAPSRGQLHLVSLALQRRCDHRANVSLVVHNEDASGLARFHARAGIRARHRKHRCRGCIRVDAAPVSFPVSRQCSVHLRRGNPLNLGTSISQFAKSALFLKRIIVARNTC